MKDTPSGKRIDPARIDPEKINLAKIGYALIYFASNTENCGVTKANKLLYYFDCYHIKEHGRRVIKDTYRKLPEGPVPSHTYNRIRSILELKYGTEDATPIRNRSFHEELMEFIDIKIEVLDASKCVYRYRILPRKPFDPRVFSKSELAVMQQVAEEYREATAAQLTRKSHRELPYKAAFSNDRVDLKLFAKGQVSKEQYAEIEYIEKISDSLALNYG